VIIGYLVKEIVCYNLPRLSGKQGCKKSKTRYLHQTRRPNLLLALPRLVSRQRRRPVVQEQICLLRRRMRLAHFREPLICRKRKDISSECFVGWWNSHVGSSSIKTKCFSGQVFPAAASSLLRCLCSFCRTGIGLGSAFTAPERLKSPR
jgi:hypothetical protein